jgi:AraC-like DNA-binding protein
MLAMTSGTLRDAITVAERYMRLRAPELSLRTWQEEDSFVCEFQNHVPPQLLVFFGESMFVMLVQLARTLLGHAVRVRCEMAFAKPAHFHRFAHLLPGSVSFGGVANRIWLPRALLDEAVVTADAVTARRMERECQRELAALRKQASVLVEVRQHLSGAEGEYPTLEQVAERMGSSSRTLKRRLAQQGTSYRAIVDGLRRERASMLLKTSTLTLEQIASLTGYSDVASLHRSFRRWFKQTPASLRARSITPSSS